MKKRGGTCPPRFFVKENMYLCGMNYTVTSKEATIAADEFIARYRDVERIGAFCLQCPGYGKSWACPPFDFDPRTVSDGFSTVQLIGTTIEKPGPHSYGESGTSTEGMIEEVLQTLLPHLYELERQHPGSRCFTFRCTLCPNGCTRPEGKPCRLPDRMRYSLEAVGFDVSAACRDLLGIDLEWSSRGSVSKHITLITAVFRK